MTLTRRSICLGGLSVGVVRLAAPGPVSAQGFEVGFRSLEAGPGRQRLLGTGETRIWGYGGSIPGPLLRLAKGQPLRVRLRNGLAQPTTLCWHGMRCPNAMDGVAFLTQQPVAPGASFDYAFTPPDSGLFWYHPSIWPHTAEQMARGLHGVVIVDESTPPPVDDDVLVSIADWVIGSGGQIVGDFLEPAQAARSGRIGSLVTVNGRDAPATLVTRPGSRLRVRLLNACSARIAIVAVTGATPMVIAIDGQPSALFRPAGDAVPIGPGSRVEMMLDLPGGDGGGAASVVLRQSHGEDADPAGHRPGEGQRGEVPLLVVTMRGASRPPLAPVAPLPANPLLPTRIRLERSMRKTIALGGGADPVPAPAYTRPAGGPGAPWLWTIGGRGSDGHDEEPLFEAKRGSPVTLALRNDTAFVQQIHLHGHVFRILHDLDDGWDPYWRDSILLAPARTKHIAFVADNPGKWAIVSSVIDRQMTGMAAWFRVTDHS